jgi:hypothetical protein
MRPVGKSCRLGTGTVPSYTLIELGTGMVYKGAIPM